MDDFCIAYVTTFRNEKNIGYILDEIISLKESSYLTKDQFEYLTYGLEVEELNDRLIFNEVKNTVTIFNDEVGNPNVLAELIHRVLKFVHSEQKISFEWAAFNRADPGSSECFFGGGAAAVSRKHLLVKNTLNVSDELLKEII